jgi:hypothetical protein
LTDDRNEKSDKIMIHIVCNLADVAVLQQAIELDETLAGDVLQVHDDFAVGPIQALDTDEGRAARKHWWAAVLAGSDYEQSLNDENKDDEKMLAGVIERLQADENEVLWIWAAQNKHDVCSYYWLVSRLKEYQGRVFILYLNNLPFINEKGQIFYPEWLHTIPPREFLKAKKLARTVTLSEFEVDPDEWTRLANEEKGVRLLEGGKKLVQYETDFYDADLKRFITGDFAKAGKIIGQFLSKNRHTTGDAYMLWRLKQLLQDENFETQGVVKNMKDFEVRSKTGLRKDGAAAENSAAADTAS